MLPSFHRLATVLDRAGDVLLPTLARLVFAGVLLVYFWGSAVTKLGPGLLGIVRPDAGAYIQIFPRGFEAVGYDTSQFGLYHWAVVTTGTLAEFVLPALIVVGLLTRFAALAMIGFIVVQSATDIVGHGADDATIGQWFDRTSDALILDQRAFWSLALVTLVLKGAGPLSLDRLAFGQPPLTQAPL